MQGLFDRKRPDAEAVRKVKAFVTERFGLPETTTLAVAELRCHEPGCPPIETVVTARDAEGGTINWRIAKPINDVTAADVETLESPT
jgi:hypothetical protein